MLCREWTRDGGYEAKRADPTEMIGVRKRDDRGKWAEHHLSCGSETGKMTRGESFTLLISLKWQVAELWLPFSATPLWACTLCQVIAITLLILQSHVWEENKEMKKGNALCYNKCKGMCSFLTQWSFCIFEVSFSSPWVNNWPPLDLQLLKLQRIFISYHPEGNETGQENSLRGAWVGESVKCLIGSWLRSWSQGCEFKPQHGAS